MKWMCFVLHKCDAFIFHHWGPTRMNRSLSLLRIISRKSKGASLGLTQSKMKHGQLIYVILRQKQKVWMWNHVLFKFSMCRAQKNFRNWRRIEFSGAFLNHSISYPFPLASFPWWKLFLYQAMFYEFYTGKLLCCWLTVSTSS